MSQSSACSLGRTVLVEQLGAGLSSDEIEDALALLEQRRRDLLGQAVERPGAVLDDAGRRRDRRRTGGR